MGVHTVTHTCGHDYEYKLNGNARTRESYVNWLATRPCPACRREARKESAIEALCPDGLPEIGGGSEKQIAWAEKIREKQIAEIYSGFSLENLHFRSVVDDEILSEDYNRYDAADDATTEALRDYVQELFARRPDAKSWIDNRFELVNPHEFLEERRRQLRAALRNKRYEALAGKIIAERDARKKHAEPDKISPNGKRKLSKDHANLLKLMVYVNNATRDFVIVDKREADGDALRLDGYFFCSPLLSSDEKIKTEIARFRDASRRAEKAAALLVLSSASEAYYKRREEGLDVGISPLMAAAALRKYCYYYDSDTSDEGVISCVNSLARRALASEITVFIRKNEMRVNPYKVMDALEALYKHCYFSGVDSTLVCGILPIVALVHKDNSVYDYAQEILASPKIADFAQKIKDRLFDAELTKYEFRGRFPDLRSLAHSAIKSGLIAYIDDLAGKWGDEEK